MDEQVLVFPTRLFEELGVFRGFSKRLDYYLPVLLRSENLGYLPRSQAEDDPSFKQLVPYVVLKAQEQVYCYERGKKGTESRLHRLLSIGVGGHICKADGLEGAIAYETGFARELAEEVDIQTTYRGRIAGMVHDDSTPVGAVHFGVVHLLELAEPSVLPRDLALADARFRPIAEVRGLRDRFESWSQFTIDKLIVDAV